MTCDNLREEDEGINCVRNSRSKNFSYTLANTTLNELRQTSIKAQGESLRQQERLSEVMALGAHKQKLETSRAEAGEIRLVMQEQTQSEALLKQELSAEQTRLAELNRLLAGLEKELNLAKTK